jgi:DNA-binding winged helix-turn-helix (wHTH) protein
METSPVTEFGPFRLDTVNAQLLRDGEAVPLPPKTFDVLRVPVSRVSEQVEKYP